MLHTKIIRPKIKHLSPELSTAFHDYGDVLFVDASSIFGHTSSLKYVTELMKRSTKATVLVGK